MTVQKLRKYLVANEGFTLIELLIVIAILGVLAVVVLVAINPVQQLARTRDAGRESGVTQLGHAVEAYAISHGGLYPAAAAAWAQDLVDSGEISVIPSGITDSAGLGPCTTLAVNTTWCYDNDTGIPASIVYSQLEADVNESLCPTAGDETYFVYSTADGRGGIVCVNAGEPAAGTQTFVN